MKQEIKGWKGKYKVYVHINKINNKIYIGQTCNDFKRRCGGNGNNYKHSAHFYNAIKKYGWDNFDHIVLIDGISLDVANIIEEELIKKYNSMNNKLGYNMIAGGNNRKMRQESIDKRAEKNRHPSQETLRKMSLASKGRKHTPEQIEKIRKSNIGKKRSLEARRKMSIAKKNMSEETRKKISEAGKGRKQSLKQRQLSSIRFTGNKYRAKPVAQYDLDGKFIKAWECAMDVEKEWKIKHLHSGIAACCNDKKQKSHDYQWKYFYGDSSNIEPYKSTRKIEVEQYSLDGKYIKTYESISSAARDNNTTPGNISKCCKGEAKITSGYQWKYVDDDKIIKNIEYKYIDVINGDRYKRKQDIKDQTCLSDLDIMKCLKNNEVITKNSMSYKIELLSA